MRRGFRLVGGANAGQCVAKTETHAGFAHVEVPEAGGHFHRQLVFLQVDEERLAPRTGHIFALHFEEAEARLHGAPARDLHLAFAKETIGVVADRSELFAFDRSGRRVDCEHRSPHLHRTGQLQVQTQTFGTDPR
ncbi:hypothetical protein D3C84_658960 [compost metagenome]